MNEDINLLRSLCWSFHHTTGIHFEDLLDAALDKYYEVIEEYDPKRAKRSTYLFMVMKSFLIWWTQRRREWPVTDIDIVGYTKTPFYEYFTQIDKDVREVFDIVLSSPEEFNSVTPRTARSKLTFILREKEWTWKRIENVLKKARMYVNQVDEGGIIL